MSRNDPFLDEGAVLLEDLNAIVRSIAGVYKPVV